MMKIDRHNYEVFVLDYLEGKLSADQHAAMEAFLLANPDIAEEIEGLNEFTLEAPLEGNIDKDSLKKGALISENIDLENWEHYAVAYHEDDLSISEESELFRFLEAHPEKDKEFQLFASVKMKPDEAIIFENKEALKKKERVVVIPLYLRVAASLVIVFLLGLFLRPDAKQIAYQERSSMPKTMPEAQDSFEISFAEEIESTAEETPQRESYIAETTTVKEEPIKKEETSIDEGMIAAISPQVIEPRSEDEVIAEHETSTPVEEDIAYEEEPVQESVAEEATPEAIASDPSSKEKPLLTINRRNNRSDDELYADNGSRSILRIKRPQIALEEKKERRFGPIVIKKGN